jgi:hypothetical protein
MTFQPMMAEDIICILSHKIQSAWGTRLVDADFETPLGHRVLLNTATMGDVKIARAGVGPRTGGRTEHSIASNKRVVGHESSLPIMLDADSHTVGIALSHILRQDTSTQEGTTGHYTHDMHCSNPLDPDEDFPGRDCFLTSAYLDSGSEDVDRLIRLFSDLIYQGATLSGKGKDLVALALDLVGSGLIFDQDSSVPPTITIPDVATLAKFGNDGLKFEYGNRAGALTDISERVDQWSLRFDQQLCALDKRYYPGSGMYAKRAWFIRRKFGIEMSMFVNRENKDLLEDMVQLTRKELKVTLDSGVVAGTGTSNHKLILRYPDIQITESPLNHDSEGAVYAVRVDADDINLDSADADSPVKATLHNTTPAYLVLPA